MADFDNQGSQAWVADFENQGSQALVLILRYRLSGLGG